MKKLPSTKSPKAQLLTTVTLIVEAIVLGAASLELQRDGFLFLSACSMALAGLFLAYVAEPRLFLLRLRWSIGRLRRKIRQQ
jgi:hypothetical protein